MIHLVLSDIQGSVRTEIWIRYDSRGTRSINGCGCPWKILSLKTEVGDFNCFCEVCFLAKHEMQVNSEAEGVIPMVAREHSCLDVK